MNYLMRTVIIVLGMHRSGTSAITGLLQQLDIYLGSNTFAPQEDNVKGFFENIKVLNLNIKILGENFSSYEDTEYTLNIAKEKHSVYVQEAKQIIEEEFSKNTLFAIKDPRLCITFPVWEEAFKYFNIKIKILLPYRNPFEIAQSLKTRNNFSIEKSLLLWAKHFFHAELYSRKYERYFIDFTDLVNNTNGILNILQKFLKIDLKDASQRIEGFIEKELKHHNLSYDTINQDMPYFLTKTIKMMKHNELNTTDNESYDALREQFLTTKSIFHKPDIIENIPEFKTIHSTAEKFQRQVFLMNNFSKIVTFDASYYSQKHNMEHQNEKELLQHFISHGMKKGLMPNFFCEQYKIQVKYLRDCFHDFFHQQLIKYKQIEQIDALKQSEKALQTELAIKEKQLQILLGENIHD